MLCGLLPAATQPASAACWGRGTDLTKCRCSAARTLFASTAMQWWVLPAIACSQLGCLSCRLGLVASADKSELQWLTAQLHALLVQAMTPAGHLLCSQQLLGYSSWPAPFPSAQSLTCACPFSILQDNKHEQVKIPRHPNTLPSSCCEGTVQRMTLLISTSSIPNSVFALPTRPHVQADQLLILTHLRQRPPSSLVRSCKIIVQGKLRSTVRAASTRLRTPSVPQPSAASRCIVKE